VVRERTRDQEVEWSDTETRVGWLTGDADVDNLLGPYVRRAHVGAA
jgi:hypothetical protein